MLYREMIPIEPRVNITNVAPTKKERQKGTKRDKNSRFLPPSADPILSVSMFYKLR